MSKHKRNIILFVMVLCLVTFLIGRVVALRMRAYLQDLDNQIAQVEKQYNEATSEIKANYEYVEQWNRIRAFLNEPLAERQIKFSAYLDKLKKESEIEITSHGPFMPRRMEDHAEFQILSYTLNFFCDLNGLVELLDRLDGEDQRLLLIETLEVSPRPKPSYPVPPRYSQDLPGSRPLPLAGVMTVLMPAVSPTSEATEDEKEPS